MLGAPFLGAEFLIQAYSGTHDMRLAGLMGIPYVIGWMACIWALYRMEAAGSSRWGRGILGVSLFLLCMANGWNIYAAIDPKASSLLYRILDICWPASNVFMIVVGVAVIRANVLSGWRRYVPLAVGLWLPLTAISSVAIGHNSLVALTFSAIYSIVMWTMLGYAVRSTEDQTFQRLSL
jgi:hypothetical protein